MNDGLKDAHREALVAAMSGNPRIERAVLFGSRAMGTNSPASDVDIALFGDELTLDDHAKLAAAADELPMAQRVDFVLHHRISSPELKKHIAEHGIEWFVRGRTAPQGAKA